MAIDKKSMTLLFKWLSEMREILRRGKQREGRVPPLEGAIGLH